MVKLLGTIGWVLAAVFGTLLAVGWYGWEIQVPAKPVEASVSASSPSDKTSAVAEARQLAAGLLKKYQKDQLQDRTELIDFLKELDAELKGGSAQSLDESARSLHTTATGIDHSEISSLSDAIRKAVEGKRQGELEQWVREAEKLFAETEASCAADPIDAQNMEALLRRSEALEAQKRTIRLSIPDLPSKRLRSCLETTKALLTYHQNLAKGFSEQAAEKLQGNYALRQAEFPVMTKARISDLIVDAVGSSEAQEAIRGRQEAEWIEQVNRFFQDTETLCQQEEVDSLQVEALLIRAIGLEHEVPSRRDSMLEVAGEKLKSATDALKTWMRYAHLMDRGFAEEAKSVLGRFEPGRSDFPAVSKERIEALIQASVRAEDPEVRGIGRAVEILQTIQAPERAQIEAAMATFQAMANEKGDDELSKEMIELLKALSSGLELLAAGDPKAAYFRAAMDIHVRYPDATPEMVRVRNQVLMKILPVRFAELNPPEAVEGESPAIYLHRLLLGNLGSDPVQNRYDLLIAYDYAIKAAELPKPEWLENDKTAHRFFRMARRMEEAGDLLYALKTYRSALRQDDCKFPLDDEVKVRIAAIQESNPELFEPSNEAVLQQLEEIRGRLQALQQRMPSPLRSR